MDGRRSPVRLSLAAAGVVVVAALAGPAAAQSTNRALIDRLHLQLLYVALPLSLFVELILLYAVVRFRDNDDPRPTTDDPALEITWTAATAVVLVFAGVSGYFVFASPYLTPTQAAAPGGVANGSGAVAGNGAGNGSGPGGGGGVPADAVAVEVLAYQWGWQVTYPAANVTTQNRLVVPTDRDVFVRLTASDVVHSLYVPALGIKQDAFPGQETLVRTRVTEPGRYRLYCTELCGAGHARMQGTVVALNASAYEAWLADRGVPADGTTATVAGDGEGAAASSIPPGSSLPAGAASRPATRGAAAPATPGPVAG